MAVVLSGGQLRCPLLQHVAGQHQLADDAVHDRPADRHPVHHVGSRPLELPLGGECWGWSFRWVVSEDGHALGGELGVISVHRRAGLRCFLPPPGAV